MSWLMLSDVASMTQGKLSGEDTAINAVCTDSRKARHDHLFIAIQGDRYDAHDFVAKMEGKIAGALVHKEIACKVPQVRVDDTRKALARFAKSWRQRVNKPVIGLTGSNGKTTLKEMIAAILSETSNVLATQGNFNNDIGMPLTLLRIRAEHDVAVIEMGANHFGEIAFLTDIARPDIAVINNAGAAHLEGFGDVAGVAKAKGEIFQGLVPGGTAVINADDPYANYWLGLVGEHKVIRFGLECEAEIKGVYQGNGKLHLITPAGERQMQLKLLGKHNAMNALAAAAVASAAGADLQQIQSGLESLKPVAGRLAMMPGKHGSILIDDTYNANPTSALAALDVLAEATGERLFVLGDMGELGAGSAHLHAEIGKKAQQAGIDNMFCLGQHSALACEKFGKPEHAYQDKEALLSALEKEIKNSMTILVKGSRSARMEQIVAAIKETGVEAGVVEDRSEPC